MFVTKKLIFCLICLALIFNQACVPVLVGTAGLVAGYTLSNDSAIGNVNAGYTQLWKACQRVLEDMEADINFIKESSGLIKAVISDHEVTIKIDTIGSRLQKLKVSARKNLLPKPQFAQKIFLRIIEILK